MLIINIIFILYLLSPLFTKKEID